MYITYPIIYDCYLWFSYIEHSFSKKILTSYSLSIITLILNTSLLGEFHTKPIKIYDQKCVKKNIIKSMILTLLHSHTLELSTLCGMLIVLVTFVNLNFPLLFRSFYLLDFFQSLFFSWIFKQQSMTVYIYS